MILSDICQYVSEKISVSSLDENTYISTENMLPNKSGITVATNLPATEYTPKYNTDDILISNIRPYFKKIYKAQKQGGCSADVLVLRAKQGIIPSFLYYVLSDDAFFEYATATSKGTKMPRGDKIAIMKYKVPNVSPEIQQKIASILSALDHKIELNQRQNNNLEQQAQALFNEKIVNNLKQGCIGDYCSIKSGFAFKSSWWQNTGVRVIKIKNIEPSGLNLQECSFVSEDKVSIAKEFIVKGGDLLIAMTGATIGKFAIVPHVDEILLVNQRVGKFFLGDNPLEKLPFIYCTLKQPEVVSEIINRGQGSAQPNISGNDIMSITCNYPDENIIAGFNNICRPYFEKIITNQYENTRLAAIRDALLPKLMSGEIDVSNVDISALTSTDKLSFSEE